MLVDLSMRINNSFEIGFGQLTRTNDFSGMA